MDETVIPIGKAPDPWGDGAGQGESAGRCAATVCPQCGQHFSADGRFCPFDGEPLRPAPDWDPSSDPLLGIVVDDRYEIASVIGEGGMGIVYAARHRALGKRFALKALRKDLASDHEIAARFMQEARTAASISHPGLVEITDFGKLPTGQPFFVMALLEGQSLAHLIRRGGPIPAARGIEIVRQIAEALGAAHDRSIVHRDLKPDNIHISVGAAGKDHVTIVDFGLAKVIGASRLTRAGMVFGTPHYMSPEQAQGDPTDHRADIYALGVVMYEMFTGRVPFEADSYMGVLTKHMYMAPTPPSQLVGIEKLGVLEDIILRCMEKKPDHRYASLRELSRDLDLALNPKGPRPLSARQRRTTPRSLLADELELPSREERAAATPRRWVEALAVVAGDRRRRTISGGHRFHVGVSCLYGLSAAARSRPDLERWASPPAASPNARAARCSFCGSAVVRPARRPIRRRREWSPVIQRSHRRLPEACPAHPACRHCPACAPGPSRLPECARSCHSRREQRKKRPCPSGGSEIVDPWAK